MRPVRIVVLAKAPLPGLAKTRLIPALGPAGAAALAWRLLEHTLTQATEAAVGPVQLCAAPPLNHPGWQELSLPDGLHLSEQGDGDLGARLDEVAESVCGTGAAVLLVGSDCPQLTSDHFRLAAAALIEYDSCLVPVRDGGYALLGLNRYHPSLFADIPWSTSAVAGLTRRRIEALGWSTREFAPLHDIDEPADLRWLPASLALDPEVRTFLASAAAGASAATGDAPVTTDTTIQRTARQAPRE